MYLPLPPYPYSNELISKKTVCCIVHTVADTTEGIYIDHVSFCYIPGSDNTLESARLYQAPDSSPIREFDSFDVCSQK
jgi:hypothetical protein